MRIDALSLVRYGHFSDHSIQLDRPNTDLDLHVIYGDNEAGKSTSYHAILDLLFGIKPKQPPYAFKYTRGELRIDATLSSGDTLRQLTRTGKGLLDSSGTLLDELVLSQWLGDLNRDRYSAMFSMNEGSLQAGGKDILESKGDLGQVLFSAGSGIGDIDGQLERLTSESASYYASGKSLKLSPLKTDLKTLKEIESDLKEIDVQANTWTQLKNALSNNQQAFDKKDAAWKSVDTRVKQLELSLDWRQRALNILENQATINAQEKLPNIPDTWWKSIDTFVAAARATIEHQEKLTRRLDEINRALTEPAPQQMLIDCQPTIAALCKADIELASEQKRIETEQARRDDASKLARTLLEQLEIDKTTDTFDDPLLNSEKRTHCSKLISNWGALNQACRTNQEELIRDTEYFNNLPAVGNTKPADSSALERACTAIEQDEDARPASELRLRLHEQQEGVTTAIAELGPWRGTLTSLEQIDVPLQSTLNSLKEQEQNAASDRDSATVEHKGVLKRIDELAAQEFEQPSPEDQIDWETQQRQRLTHWREHRDAIASELPVEQLMETANTFEQAMLESDRLFTSRETDLKALAARQALEKRRQELERELNLADKTLLEAKQQYENTRASIDHQALKLGLGQGLSVDDLQQWLNQRKSALQQGIALETTERRLAERKKRRQEQADRLLSLLQAATIEVDTHSNISLEERLAEARDAVTELKDQQKHYEDATQKRSEAQRTLTKRQQASEASERKLEAWNADWHHATDHTCLSNLTPQVAHDRLLKLERLADAKQLIRQHDQARTELESARVVHEKSIERLSQQCEGMFDTSKRNRLTALEDASKHAASKRAERLTLSKEHSALVQEFAELKREKKTLLEDLDARYQKLNVASLDELQSRIRNCRDQQQLQSNIETETRKLLIKATGEHTLESLAHIDEAALHADIEHAKNELEEIHTSRDACLVALEKARTELEAVGSDNEAARLHEQHKMLLTRIRESMHTTLSIRLGVATAREGLRRWRKNNRSEMLKDANEAFARITNGHFLSLDAEPSGAGEEVLYAKAADGSAKVADDLSTGTRFQLYLALRVAAYKRWCRQRTPLPFVADDVLETFDDTRTARTFSAFKDIAQSGQVIYLTHHRHVIDIARDVTDGAVCVHELPQR